MQMIYKLISMSTGTEIFCPGNEMIHEWVIFTEYRDTEYAHWIYLLWSPRSTRLLQDKKPWVDGNRRA